MTAPSGRAMRRSFTSGDALDAHSSQPRHRRGTHPSRGGRCCWCMVELNQLLQPLPVIGTDQEHCPMLLGAAASTLETMLSLSVNIDVDSAGASPTDFRTMVTADGDR